MRTPLKRRWHYKKYTNSMMCFFLLSFMHFNNQKGVYELLETEDIIEAFQECILSSQNLLRRNYEILFLNLTSVTNSFYSFHLPQNHLHLIHHVIKIINIEGEIKISIIFHQSKFFFSGCGYKYIL